MTTNRVGLDRSAPSPGVVASDLDGVAEIVDWLKAGRDRVGDPRRLVEVMHQVPLRSAVRLRKDVEAWVRTTGRSPAAGA
jgi:hypothetical protein